MGGQKAEKDKGLYKDGQWIGTRVRLGHPVDAWINKAHAGARVLEPDDPGDPIEPGWHRVVANNVPMHEEPPGSSKRLPTALIKGQRVHVPEGQKNDVEAGLYDNGKWIGSRVKLNTPEVGWINKTGDDGLKVLERDSNQADLTDPFKPGWYHVVGDKIPVQNGDDGNSGDLSDKLKKGERVFVPEGDKDDEAKGLFKDGLWRTPRVKLSKPVAGWITGVGKDGAKVLQRDDDQSDPKTNDGAKDPNGAGQGSDANNGKDPRLGLGGDGTGQAQNGDASDPNRPNRWSRRDSKGRDGKDKDPSPDTGGNNANKGSTPGEEENSDDDEVDDKNWYVLDHPVDVRKAEDPQSEKIGELPAQTRVCVAGASQR